MKTLEEFTAHYKAVRNRLNGIPQKKDPLPKPAVKKKPKLEPKPELVGEEKPRLTPLTPAQIIIREVAGKHGVTTDDIRGVSRKVEFVRARQEAVYEIKKRLHMSLPLIGKVIGNKDHTTVLHGIRKHAKINNLPDLCVFKKDKEQNYFYILTGENNLPFE